jgi:hypothetical protein
MYCPTCGTENPKGATTCQACGDPIQVTIAAVPPTNNLAIFSLVASILGWVAAPVIGHIAGIVLGHIARNEIAHSGGTQGGDGLALAGLVVGYAGLALSILSILGGLAFLGLGIGCGLCALLSAFFDGRMEGLALLRLFQPPC